MAKGPFIKAINAHFTLLLQGNIVTSLPIKSFKVRPDVSEIKDDLCGELRTRLDVILNGYSGSFDMNQETLKLFDQLVTYHDLKNKNIDLGPELGVRIDALDGSAPGLYSFGGQFIFGAWDMGIQGRSDRISVSVPFMAQEFFKL